ncbi:MAG: hypothetical protein ACXV4A_04110 [Actinomycetes bacterium]
MSGAGGSRRLLAVTVAVAAGLMATASCTVATNGQQRPHAGTASASASAVPASAASPARMRAMAQAMLDRRAKALRDGDYAAFTADLDRSDPAFVRRQRRYFDNLEQLPLQRFSYQVSADRWNPFYAAKRWRSSAYIPYVRQRMQLRGFDRYPVDTVFGITFAWHDGRWRIVSDTDVRGRTEDGAQDAPWDLTAIRAIRTRHVLGIFDTGSAAHAAIVMRAARNSIAIVSHRLPVHWDRRAVVYALSDRAALKHLGGIPGGDPDALAAISFPVLSKPGHDGRLAAMRVLVHPDYVSSIHPAHDHLLTHEMTHVATASQTHGGPVWVDEGLAEWVATGHVDPYSWGYERALIVRAAQGVHEMPSTYTFNTVDQEWNYDLALMACDYIAEKDGPSTLWRTFLALQRDYYPQTDTQQDSVLRRMIGMSSHQLAAQAARHMVQSSVYAGLAKAS